MVHHQNRNGSLTSFPNLSPEFFPQPTRNDAWHVFRRDVSKLIDIEIEREIVAALQSCFIQHDRAQWVGQGIGELRKRGLRRDYFLGNAIPSAAFAASTDGWNFGPLLSTKSTNTGISLDSRCSLI